MPATEAQGTSAVWPSLSALTKRAMAVGLYLLLPNRFYFLHFYRQQHTAFMTDTFKADAGPGKWKIGSP